MKMAIMQPYLFPYIGYFQLINLVDSFVLFDDVNYIKKGWINRNNILINGEKHTLTLPLQAASQNKLINELYVHNEPKYLKKLLVKLEQAYKRAPEFIEVFPIIMDILTYEDRNLAKHIAYSLTRVCEYMNITTPIYYSSDIVKNNELRGQSKIIEICGTFGATHYINPIGGTKLYDPKQFSQKGITLSFLKPNFIQYKQYGDRFVPWLSIIDVLMFVPRDQIENLLKEYTLIEGEELEKALL